MGSSKVLATIRVITYEYTLLIPARTDRISGKYSKE
ncbi:hypothetical protein BN8_04789 [Fibrisoma limi BUZ 3]|uniref:Uncharacterized protein n=1 Tax=Fibrisoma limi BUZ 3 TaxID=1185876 RepID=I2GNP8_9BACT|nr:hypothetical protein BN8_04789 [Fibrisoma limi BUZ 3]